MQLREWTKYRDKMAQICQKAADEFRDFALNREGGIGALDRKEMLDFAYQLVSKYGQASGELACQMYELIAELQNAGIAPAQMAELPEYGDVAKAMNGAAKQGENVLPGVIYRLVKQTSADTMLQNAKRDGAYFAWVSSGDTCAYCRMLSAIGWQKAGKKTIQKQHAEHIHGNCDCQYIIDFKGDMEIKGYDPIAMQNEIMETVDPDQEFYTNFDSFLNANGRQTWSSKGHSYPGLAALRAGRKMEY